MNFTEDIRNEIKLKASKEAEVLLNNVGIFMCFGDMPIPNYTPYLSITEFKSNESIKRIEKEHIDKVKKVAEHTIQCVNCKLYERCFNLSLLRYLSEISFRVANVDSKIGWSGAI